MIGLRNVARREAAEIYRAVSRELFGFIERRIEWRRANAPLLALEAKHMVQLLEDAPGFIWFRKARLADWRNRWRKHEARALAADELRMLALACGLDGDGCS